MDYREINFTYEFDGVDNFDEGLEVSFLNWNASTTEWIPIHYFSAHNASVRSEQNISLGDVSEGEESLVLRGYPVNFTVNESQSEVEATIRICGPNVFSASTEDQLYNWEFRWLQTAAAGDNENDTDGDVVYIYNVTITVVNSTGNDTGQLIFEDNLESMG